MIDLHRSTGRLRTRRAAALVALSASAALGLAACGSSSSGSSTTAGSTGGTLKWAWYLPTSWDPITSSAGTDVHDLSLVYAALTQTDSVGTAVPGLATAWKYNSNGTQVTFTLRPGLTFSDGTTLDATAVKQSLERSKNDPKSLVAAQLSTVKDIVAVNPTTVQIDLSTPNYQIPNLLSGKTGMIVSPTAFTKNAAGLATAPVGAGPFKLTSYVPNQEADLVKNNTFWNAANIKVAGINVVPAADPTTAVAQVQSGQVNVASIPGSQVDAAKAAGLNVSILPSLAVSILDVNNSVAPFNNPKVVQAINYALDRQALLQTAQFGHGVVDYQPFPPGYVGFNPSVGVLYPHDVDKAKALLAAAGYPNGLSVTLSTYSATGTAEQIQSQLGQAGITVNLDVIPLSEFAQQVYIQRSKPFVLDGFAGRDSVAQAFQVLFGAKGLLNIGGTISPTLTAAVQKITETPLDDPTYPSVVQAATKIAVETMPNIFLYTTPRIFASQPSVTGLQDYLAVQRFEGVQVG